MQASSSPQRESRDRVAAYWTAYFHWRLDPSDGQAILAVASAAKKDLASDAIAEEDVARVRKLVVLIERELAAKQEADDDYVWIV